MISGFFKIELFLYQMKDLIVLLLRMTQTIDNNRKNSIRT